MEVDGKLYSIGGLDTFTQLNIARRLAPLSVLIQGMTDERNKDKDTTMLVVLMLAQLSDSDSDYVVKKCLAVVTLQQKDSWAKVLSPSGELMFDDMSMQTVINLTTQVVLENLGDFFRTTLSKVQKGIAAAT